MIPLVMGVLNVTPDSFSDGGRWLDAQAAVAHGHELIAEGAVVVDVGGESTRPGAAPVDEAEELRRVVPVVEALAGAPEVVGGRVRISVDTRKRAVAEAALDAGASLVNDVSASLYEVAAEAGAGWVAMHMQGEPASMQLQPHYDDVVAEVRSYLVERADKAAAAGVAEIWIDPGIGFGKTFEHNLCLLKHLDLLVGTGWPVLVGTSRKGFLGRMAADSDERARRDERGRPNAGGAGEAGSPGALRQPAGSAVSPVPPSDRLEGSVATEVWAMHMGARMVRAHDVRAAVQAARVIGYDTNTETT